VPDPALTAEPLASPDVGVKYRGTVVEQIKAEDRRYHCGKARLMMVRA